MKNLKEFNSIQEVKQAVIDGKDVFWNNSFYKLKIDIDGDCVIKCTQNSSQELLTEKHSLTEFYIF
jgi:hypothetical protein